MRTTILGLMTCAHLALSIASAATVSPKVASPAAPDAAVLLKNASYPISVAKGQLGGEGHMRLMRALAKKAEMTLTGFPNPF